MLRKGGLECVRTHPVLVRVHADARQVVVFENAPREKVCLWKG